MHRLYLAVHERAEVKLELLPAEFFRQLAARCGDCVRLTAVLQGPRIVAFAWGILFGNAYQNVFVGLDYQLNDEFDLYFNLMASDLDHALRLGAAEIQTGQTADVFKSRLGCRGQPRYVYAKGTRWFSAAPLRWTHTLLMPPPPAARSATCSAKRDASRMLCLDATAGLSSSADSTVGQANRGTRCYRNKTCNRRTPSRRR